MSPEDSGVLLVSVCSMLPSLERSIHCSPDDAGDLIEHAGPQRENFHIAQPKSADLLHCRINFSGRARALHEHKLAARSQEGSGERDQLAKGAHCARGHLIKRCREVRILCTITYDGNVRQTELIDLLGQPGNPALHRLDEDEGDIWAGDREHKARQTGAAPHIADHTGPQERCDDRTVQDVPAPEPGEFEWTDQAPLLALLSEIGGEPARVIQLCTEE
ncbi:MAG: hypothetical protein QOD05_1131 [Microbacteriaceae bacterium]|nr:hypothetical protein [Microbacteriaceae bacterium]